MMLPIGKAAMPERDAGPVYSRHPSFTNRSLENPVPCIRLLPI